MREQNGMDENQEGEWALVSVRHAAEAYETTPTHSSFSRYGSSNGGSGGSGGGGAPQGCWLLLPRVNICWKLMSVWVQLSTQSAIPMVTGNKPPGGPARPARLRAPRLRMLFSTGSRMSRVGSPERRDSSFPFTWKTQSTSKWWRRDGSKWGGANLIKRRLFG